MLHFVTAQKLSKIAYPEYVTIDYATAPAAALSTWIAGTDMLSLDGGGSSPTSLMACRSASPDSSIEWRKRRTSLQS